MFITQLKYKPLLNYPDKSHILTNDICKNVTQ